LPVIKQNGETNTAKNEIVKEHEARSRYQTILYQLPEAKAEYPS
jgi:hypothetical protein